MTFVFSKYLEAHLGLFFFPLWSTLSFLDFIRWLHLFQIFTHFYVAGIQDIVLITHSFGEDHSRLLCQQKECSGVTVQMQAQYEAYNIICFIIMKLSAALLIRKLSDHCITEYVTQAKNVVDFFFWMSSLCFLKHNLGATLPLARRIPEQQGSSGNI